MDFPKQELLRSRFHPNFAFDLQETGKCIFRRLQNALLQAPKETHCSQKNAFTGAAKMHFATVPERMLCADNGSKTNRTDPANAGCGPSNTQTVSTAVRFPGVPNPKDHRETLCPTPARDYRQTPWSAQPQGLTAVRLAGVTNSRTPRPYFPNGGLSKAQSFFRTAGTIAISIPSKFCFRPSGNRKMHFSTPAKCTSAGAQKDTLLPKKCVYRGCQNAIRHLARENALRIFRVAANALRAIPNAFLTQ